MVAITGATAVRNLASTDVVAPAAVVVGGVVAPRFPAPYNRVKAVDAIFVGAVVNLHPLVSMVIIRKKWPGHTLVADAVLSSRSCTVPNFGAEEEIGA